MGENCNEVCDVCFKAISPTEEVTMGGIIGLLGTRNCDLCGNPLGERKHHVDANRDELKKLLKKRLTSQGLRYTNRGGSVSMKSSPPPLKGLYIGDYERCTVFVRHAGSNFGYVYVEAPDGKKGWIALSLLDVYYAGAEELQPEVPHD